MNPNRTWRALGLGLVAAALLAAPAGAASQRGTTPGATGPALYTVQVIDHLGVAVMDTLAVHDASGKLVRKVHTGKDGKFSLLGVPGQKFVIARGSGEIGHPGGSRAPIVLPAAVDMKGTAQARFLAPSKASGPAKTGGDSCALATTLVVPVGGSVIDNGFLPPATGSLDPDAFFCGTFDYGNSDIGAWYNVTGTGFGMTASVCNGGSPGSFANFDTQLAVYLNCSDDACGNLTCITGADDSPGCSGFSTEVNWNSVAGQEYVVFVTSWGGDDGLYDLEVLSGGVVGTPPDNFGERCKGACCTCLSAPFDCQQEDALQCAALGATYQGDGKSCCNPVGGPLALVSTDPPLPISDLLPDVSSTITVPVGTGVIADVDVQLDITHTWIGDLSIDVSHGASTENIWANQCGSTGNIHATADDQGTEIFCAVIAAGPASTVFYNQPLAGLGNLGNFECRDADGAWTLTIADGFGGDNGTLDTWSLIVQPAAAQCGGSSSAAIPISKAGTAAGIRSR